MKKTLFALVTFCLAASAQLRVFQTSDTFRTSDLNGNFSYLNARVNGVAYPASPAVNTVPIVTSLSSGVSYVNIPNCVVALLYNSSTFTFSCASSVLPGAHAASHGVSGSDALSLDAAQIATGTVSSARLPAMGASGSNHLAGLVPDPGSIVGTTRFLNENGTWVAITGSNATQIQGRAMASTAPSNNQTVAWNTGSNQWQPLTLDTSLVGESGNLYFTNARVYAALSVTAAPLAFNSSTGVFTLPAAASGQAGYLTAADWATFNAKQAAITSGSQDQVVNGAFGLLTVPNCAASGGVLQYSTSTHLLSCHTLNMADLPNAADTTSTYSNPAWITALAYAKITGVPTFAANTTATTSQFFTAYNSTTGAFTKAQPAFTDISGSLAASQLPAHTGDATSSAGSAALTLATVNGGPGACGDSTHVCAVTTNGKGLVTAQTSTLITSGASGCKLASSLGFLMNGTNESALMATTIASFITAGGGCLFIDGGKSIRLDSQLVTEPTQSGAGAYVPIRITGDGATIYGETGSSLDLRYASGPGIWANSNSSFTIDHITLKNTTNCQPLLKVTLSTLYVFQAGFLGSGALKSACNDAIVLGGTSGSTATDYTINSAYNGFGSVIRDSHFYRTQHMVLAQNGVNGLVIDGNSNQGGSTTTKVPVIEFVGAGSGANANRGNVVRDNVIEGGAVDGSGWSSTHSCAIKFTNTEYSVIEGNGFWDFFSGTFGLCGSSSGIKNTIGRDNYLDVTGALFADTNWSSNNFMPYKVIPFSFDGGGSALTGTITRCSAVSYGGVIDKFWMESDQSGNATITVKSAANSSYTGPSSTTDISNGGEAMGSAVTKGDTALVSWTTAVAPDTTFCVTLSSPATVQWVSGYVRVREGK